MSLLSIARSVCGETGLRKPSTIVTSSDQLAQQLFDLANKELRELSKKYGWLALQREGTIATVVGTASYALPADFKYYTTATAWRSGDYWRARGSLSPVEWQTRKRLLLQNLDGPSFRIYGNPARIVIDPVPDKVDNYVYEYTSKFYAKDLAGNLIAEYATDTDTSVIDEDLVQLGLLYRFKRSKGLDFSFEIAEYASAVPAAYSKEKGEQPIDIGGRVIADPLTEGYVRPYGFGV